VVSGFAAWFYFDDASGYADLLLVFFGPTKARFGPYLLLCLVWRDFTSSNAPEYFVEFFHCASREWLSLTGGIPRRGHVRLSGLAGPAAVK
jgi:hypothetical protein